MRSYLVSIQLIEMISRRLTKTQKAEILEAYRAGENTNFLAEKYSCTSNTINRTVKSLLLPIEYELLKEKRSKSISRKGKILDNKTLIRKEEHDNSHSLNSINERVNKDELAIENIDNKSEKLVSLSLEEVDRSSKMLNSDYECNDDINNNLEIIEPLLSSFDFDQEKLKSEYEILHYDSLPKSAYMIVDKKVELDSQLISDLPEWSFLPEKELQRNAILLFSNQRSAKRNCSKNQRVIKIPDSGIFKLSKSYLISRGITRLILDDSIIALDI